MAFAQGGGEVSSGREVLRGKPLIIARVVKN
jgi:hypothetical protein